MSTISLDSRLVSPTRDVPRLRYSPRVSRSTQLSPYKSGSSVPHYTHVSPDVPSDPQPFSGCLLESCPGRSFALSQGGGVRSPSGWELGTVLTGRNLKHRCLPRRRRRPFRLPSCRRRPVGPLWSPPRHGWTQVRRRAVVSTQGWYRYGRDTHVEPRPTRATPTWGVGPPKKVGVSPVGTPSPIKTVDGVVLRGILSGG